MGRAAEEAVLEYKEALDDLKDNNKMQINLMTILAEDYCSFSREIVAVIAQQVERVMPTQKLAVMYVMDSILKNVTGAGSYKEHIEKMIHKIFVHVFEAGDERTRLSLHKLRQTWTGIFQRSTLYKMDLAVHEVDPAWPVVTPQPSTDNNTSTTPRPASRVHVNPHFFNKGSDKRQLSTTTTAVVEGSKPMADPRLARASENGRAKDRRPLESIPSKNRSTQPKPALIQVKEEPRERIEDVDERRMPMASSSDDANRNNMRRREVGDRSPADGSAKRRAMAERDDESGVDEKKPRFVHDEDVRPSLVLPKPTHEIGSHAFITSLPKPHSPLSVPPSAVCVPPVQGQNATPPTTMAQLLSSMIPPSLPSTSNPFTGPPPGIGIPMMHYPGMMPPPPRFMPPAMPPPPTPPVISTDTPKMEGIPANNRIFVDGRAYEVSYVNDIPVIERNSLPHRIYFTGTPRNVIIDGVAHLMGFGEEKRVVIDDEEHVLKFGAPSRELYMGNYPFKGAFGGPPIFATINGVRHEIRLGGPPPEVKIEPDPCYELLRHMPRQGLNPTSVSRSLNPVNLTQQQTAGPGKEQMMDVKGLLAKLQRSGIFSSLNAQKEENKKKETRSPTPPIPSEHRGEVTERMAKPPTDLKKFSMRALKIRYDSVVASLHETRHMCPTCGLRFDQLKGERYERHLDWHFRENFKSNEGSRCRAWFLPADEWLHYSEHSDLTASTSTAHLDGDTGEAEENDALNSATNVNCDAVQLKECGVCGERFEEFWDEEEDAWKLKECIIGTNGKPFHPSCILDASVAPIEGSEEENGSDRDLLQTASGLLKKELLTGR